MFWSRKFWDRQWVAYYRAEKSVPLYSRALSFTCSMTVFQGFLELSRGTDMRFTQILIGAVIQYPIALLIFGLGRHLAKRVVNRTLVGGV